MTCSLSRLGMRKILRLGCQTGQQGTYDDDETRTVPEARASISSTRTPFCFGAKSDGCVVFQKSSGLFAHSGPDIDIEGLTREQCDCSNSDLYRSINMKAPRASMDEVMMRSRQSSGNGTPRCKTKIGFWRPIAARAIPPSGYQYTRASAGSVA